MDSLFQKAKQRFQDVPDDELSRGLELIKKISPNSSDEDLLELANTLNNSKQNGSLEKILVNESVKQKYGLGDYSPENRQKLVDNVQASGSPIAAAFAGFGAGLRGGDVAAGFKNAMDASQAKTRGALEAFDKNRDTKMKDFAFERDVTKADREDQNLAEMKDPNSARSKAAQDMLIQDYGMDPSVASKLTAEQVEARIPGLKQKLDRDMKEREFSERQKDRALQREIALGQKNQARQDKLEQQAKPSEKQVKEFTDFDNALDSIKSIRAQKTNQDTGPISNAQNKVAGWFGMDDAEKSAFKSQVNDQLAQYIKNISGAAVSDQERAFLMQNIPNISDNDETFNKKLDALEERLERNRQNAVTNATKMGKNVKEFERAPNRQSSKIRVSNGKETLEIDPSDEADALKDGYKRI